MFGLVGLVLNSVLESKSKPVLRIEDGKSRRNFSLLGPQISSSQIERKIVKRKVDLWHFYTNALWNQVKNKHKNKKAERESWRMRAALVGTGSLERS